MMQVDLSILALIGAFYNKRFADFSTNFTRINMKRIGDFLCP